MQNFILISFFSVIKPDGAGDIIMKDQSECAIDNSQCTSFAFCHEPNLSLQDLVMTLLNNEEKLLTLCVVKADKMNANHWIYYDDERK